MMDRVKGKTVQQIADDYNCSRGAATTYLERARTSNMVLARAKELIGEKLVPLALAVYDGKLQEGDLSAAKDVLFGFGALAKESTIKHQAADPDTLDAFRDAYFKVEPILSLPTTEVVPESSQAPSIAPVAPLLYEPKHIPHGGRASVPDQGDEDE